MKRPDWQVNVLVALDEGDYKRVLREFPEKGLKDGVEHDVLRRLVARGFDSVIKQLMAEPNKPGATLTKGHRIQRPLLGKARGKVRHDEDFALDIVKYAMLDAERRKRAWDRFVASQSTPKLAASAVSSLSEFQLQVREAALANDWEQFVRLLQEQLKGQGRWSDNGRALIAGTKNQDVAFLVQVDDGVVMKAEMAFNGEVESWCTVPVYVGTLVMSLVRE